MADVLTDQDRRLIEATCDALQLEESAKTAMLARTHAPIGKGGTNWITKSKPGNTGQLPAYIQNVRNGIMKSSEPDESKATEIAIGKVRDWAEGKGNVGPEVKAAAAAAIAEFDKMRGKRKVLESAASKRRAGQRPAKRATVSDPLAMRVEVGDLSLLETAANPGVTRFGHPIVASNLPGNSTPGARKPRRTSTGMSSQYDASKHPRGHGGEWTVGQGSSGDVVRVIQRRTGAKADGNYGAQTRQKVMDFQRGHGLKVDGVVGRQTIAAMRGDTNALHVSPGSATLADRRWLHARAAMRKIREAALSSGDRKQLDKADFAIPEKAPGPGSYPIHDVAHAKNALARCSGKPEEGRVRTAVHKRYPELKKNVQETVATGVLALRLDEDLRLVETPGLEVHERADLALVEASSGGDGHWTPLDLAVIEAATDGDVQFNADGTIDMVLIRPCNGRGVGSRIYTPEVLRRDSGIFAGLPMFDSHDSPLAKRARAGLPRPPSELGGQVLESWWDPTFTTPRDADMDFDQGAVIGRCAVTEDMEKLIRRLPRAVKVSVNMEATGLRRGMRNGKPGMLVEGLVGDPERHSIDLVTTAGAGGHVASLYRQMVAA